jgi:hypothetical protein
LIKSPPYIHVTLIQDIHRIKVTYIAPGKSKGIRNIRFFLREAFTKFTQHYTVTVLPIAASLVVFPIHRRPDWSQRSTMVRTLVNTRLHFNIVPKEERTPEGRTESRDSAALRNCGSHRGHSPHSRLLSQRACSFYPWPATSNDRRGSYSGQRANAGKEEEIVKCENNS